MVFNVVFSPNGRFLASGSQDCSVCICNIRDGSSKKLPVAGYCVSVVFSPDGRYIAAGDLRNSLWIWDSRTHKLLANWNGDGISVHCLAFTPDGKGLMSGGVARKIDYWDVSSLGRPEVSGRPVATPGRPFPLIRSFSGHTVRLYSSFIG